MQPSVFDDKGPKWMDMLARDFDNDSLIFASVILLLQMSWLQLYSPF